MKQIMLWMRVDPNEQVLLCHRLSHEISRVLFYGLHVVNPNEEVVRVFPAYEKPIGLKFSAAMTSENIPVSLTCRLVFCFDIKRVMEELPLRVAAANLWQLKSSGVEIVKHALINAVQKTVKMYSLLELGYSLDLTFMEGQIRDRVRKSLLDFGLHVHRVALSPPVPPAAYQKILIKDQVHRVRQLMRHRGVDFTAEEWRRLCEADKIKALRKHGFPTASLLHGYSPDMLMKMGLLPMSDPKKRDDK